MSLTMVPIYNYERIPPTLLSLPMELHQEIAHYLDDKSICALRLACKTTQASVDGHYETFWHKHFLNIFDIPRDVSTMNSFKYKEKYQLRKSVLKRKGTNYKTGYFKKEKIAAEILIELAMEAQPDVDDNEMPQAKNFDFMFAFCKQNPDILGCIFKPGVDMSRVKCEMLMAQVLIAPLSFDTRIPQTIYGFPESQAQVYASPVQAPLLFGHKKLDVNIPWILHVFNFFRYHFLRPEEATLFSAYTELNDTERLSLWTEPIADVPEAVLGKVWKGTYSYLDVPEVGALRQLLDEDTIGTRRSGILMDRNVDLGHRAMQVGDTYGRQPVQFCTEKGEWADNSPPQVVKFYRTDKPAIKWPKLFERVLNTHWHSPLAPPTRGTPSSRYYFEGVGFDDENFHMAGFTYPLPAQKEVPGWHRVVMMKYFVNEDDGSFENDALWAYEGVILPGGQLMVGRWWAPEDPLDGTTHDNVYSGPFIFWNVDASLPADDRGPDSTVGFEIDAAHQKAAALHVAEPGAAAFLSNGPFPDPVDIPSPFVDPLVGGLMSHQIHSHISAIMQVTGVDPPPHVVSGWVQRAAADAAAYMDPVVGHRQSVSAPETPLMTPDNLSFLPASSPSAETYESAPTPYSRAYPAGFDIGLPAFAADRLHDGDVYAADGDGDSADGAAAESGDVVAGDVCRLYGLPLAVSGAGGDGVRDEQDGGAVVVEEFGAVEGAESAVGAEVEGAITLDENEARSELEEWL